MSRTDKTDPYWVQMRDPGFPYRLTEHHFHHLSWWRGECEIDFPIPITRRPRWSPENGIRCEYRPWYWDNDKLYGRSRWRRRWGSFQDRRARADLRRLKSRWLKETDLAEIDSTQNVPTSRWRWRRWYWD